MMDMLAMLGAARGRIHPVNPVNPVCQSNLNEIIRKFGSAEQLRTAVNQLQSLLYVA